MKHFDVIIIGAGPAGLFTAINISEKYKALILEKKESAGKKLLIAGSGRCNITHDGNITEFFKHYGDNYRFLKTALQKFSNTDLENFFKNHGLNTITDKNGKIFPITENSKDVLEILKKQIKNTNVTLKCDSVVNKIELIDNNFIMTTNNDQFQSTHLVIATGGKSYPSTGSTGDGYLFSEKFGHTIIHPKPSLAPVFIKNYSFSGISGVSLSQIQIYLYRNNKKINQHCGDIGFTHKGLSGPGILDFSRHFQDGDILKLNLINKNPEELRILLIEANTQDGKMSIKNFIKRFKLPESLIILILQEHKIDLLERLSTLNKKSRIQLTEALCNYPFIIESVGGFKVSMATAGGVSLNEVSSKTMNSKFVENLYFAGEVLDIDGDTGGYNIQAAFSTAFIAAESINKTTL